MTSMPSGYSRRSFLPVGLTGFIGLAGIHLFDPFPGSAQTRRNVKNCILLYMNGGPSHIDTFDPKPGSRSGGGFKDIKTTVNALSICEHLPLIAEQAQHLAVIRSMTSKVGNHNRARYLVHTGYAPQGSMKHPSLGALVASHSEDVDFDLPHFITIGFPSYGGEALGGKYDPFFIRDPTRPIENLNPPRPINRQRINRRMSLLEWTENNFMKKFGKSGSEH